MSKQQTDYTITFHNDNDAFEGYKAFFKNYNVTFLFGHKRYNFGEDNIAGKENYNASSWLDELKIRIADENNLVKDIGELDFTTDNEEVRTIDKYIADNLAYKPVYMYDHSGLAFSTTGFSCSWDSGLLGYIYIDKETYEKEWGKSFDKAEVEKLLTSIVSEIDDINQNGYIGYKIKYSDDTEDSCWGFLRSNGDLPLDSIYEHLSLSISKEEFINKHKNDEVEYVY